MMLPNVSVPLVDAEGTPTPALLGAIPGLPAGDPVVDANGRATVLFRRTLQGIATRPLPNVAAQLTNEDGTPTRVFTALLVALR